MQGADAPSRHPKTLFTLNSTADLQQFATGCDSDIGGLSTVHLDLDGSEANIKTKATAKFWGEMSLSVKPGLEGKVRAGYAGFRNKVRTHSQDHPIACPFTYSLEQHRPTLFGEMMDDVSNYRYLALRLRVAGDHRTRDSYYVNIQTDGPVTSDLWQHRLFFQRSDGGWEDLFVSPAFYAIIFRKLMCSV
jgi:NADH dehydrogenase [ubiquinone] 1 alpha subcomplex assembly factor 1